MIYKIFFHVLLCFYFLLIRVWEEEIKNILVNLIENTYVFFQHSDVKVDTSGHSPNKKCSLLIYELFKEKLTESNVAKKALRGIEGKNDFYLHVY